MEILIGEVILIDKVKVNFIWLSKYKIMGPSLRMHRVMNCNFYL